MKKTKIIRTCGILLVALSLGTANADTVSQAQAKLFQVQLHLAKTGDPNGEFYVGEMYQQGLGTPRNLEAAHKWYEKSAAQGNLQAKNELAEWSLVLKSELQAKKRAEAAALAETKAAQEARLRAQAAAQAAALARKRAAAERVKQMEEAEAAAKKLKRERAEAVARARERARAQAAAMQARKLAQEKAQAEARKHAAAIAAAKNRANAEALARAKKVMVTDTSSHPKAKSHELHFSPDPCKGPAAQFLSTCH